MAQLKNVYISFYGQHLTLSATNKKAAKLFTKSSMICQVLLLEGNQLRVTEYLTTVTVTRNLLSHMTLGKWVVPRLVQRLIMSSRIQDLFFLALCHSE